MQSSRNYIVLPSAIRKVGCARYHLNRTRRDSYNNKRVKYYDQKLCQTLIKIFHEHRLSSVEIKKLINTPEKLSDKNSIFKMIWSRERVLGMLLLKRTKLSLLWIAVVSNYQDSAELLVSSGADVNEFYGLPSSSYELTKKSTILHALLKMYPSAWNEQFIDMVMNHGADVNAREFDRQSSLHRAVQNGRVKAVKKLLERGAEVNTTRIVGITPLLDAARTNEADELLPLLMSYGANINVTDTNGFNVLRCLTLCPDKEHVDLARLLIQKGVSPREVLVDAYESIHCAAKRGRIDLVNLLLDHGANVNALGLNNQSPLYFVAQ
ncbi:putative ankyrin repeat protein RF_0381 [Nasonia vitripennis]|uniref:Ankyrin repeat protein n=1 Tax=Nasonia vitripennis TaxID=7425 RepID=A0A7M7HE16_NASVI|nr:putative ankyrin repeat protein RF_0381 [Nasonia vitripennis]